MHYFLFYRACSVSTQQLTKEGGMVEILSVHDYDRNR